MTKTKRRSTIPETRVLLRQLTDEIRALRTQVEDLRISVGMLAAALPPTVNVWRGGA